ncbi:hypothetical protein QBC35DRAFT_486480 [Podospora australis]|uniref:Uncharacterized protein n=1 Tax=Podospora australis TaxID=1536484 RepID=A0AAN6X0V0_9PEZI|nr:hypothetical protein QBC35DRAFT_486480 [Podospora australis]
MLAAFNCLGGIFWGTGLITNLEYLGGGRPFSTSSQNEQGVLFLLGIQFVGVFTAHGAGFIALERGVLLLQNRQKIPVTVSIIISIYPIPGIPSTLPTIGGGLGFAGGVVSIGIMAR